MAENEKPKEAAADLLRRLNAATRFILASTVPLALQLDEGLKCAGTGTLFEVAKHYFILTAQHVCECDLATLFIPAHGNFRDRIVCDNFRVTLPKEQEDVDVAAIELSDITIFRLLERGYTFLTLDQVDVRGPSERAIIVGYLEANYPPSGADVMRSTTVLSHRIDTPAPVEPPALPDLDFFYHYSTTAYRVEGTNLFEQNSPELNGLSGASVWEMLRVEGVWRPEKSVYITGIQIAYSHSRYARVQSWWAIILLLCKLAPTIANEFSVKTGRSIEDLTRTSDPVPVQRCLSLLSGWTCLKRGVLRSFCLMLQNLLPRKRGS